MSCRIAELDWWISFWGKYHGIHDPCCILSGCRICNGHLLRNPPDESFCRFGAATSRTVDLNERGLTVVWKCPMKKAVFLDRDGVLNQAFVRNGKSFSPDTIEEMVIVPDAATALNRLRQQSFLLVVATNQPDIARKRLSREQVFAMNQYLGSQLPLDAIEVCEHDDADHCGCRKPHPGLLLRAAQRDGIELSEVVGWATAGAISTRGGAPSAGRYSLAMGTASISRRSPTLRSKPSPKQWIGSSSNRPNGLLRNEGQLANQRHQIRITSLH